MSRSFFFFRFRPMTTCFCGAPSCLPFSCSPRGGFSLYNIYIVCKKNVTTEPEKSSSTRPYKSLTDRMDCAALKSRACMPRRGSSRGLDYGVNGYVRGGGWGMGGQARRRGHAHHRSPPRLIVYSRSQNEASSFSRVCTVPGFCFLRPTAVQIIVFDVLVFVTFLVLTSHPTQPNPTPLSPRRTRCSDDRGVLRCGNQIPSVSTIR